MKMTLYRITVLNHINNSIKFASLLKVPFVTWNKFHLTTIFGFFTSKEVLPHISIQVVSHTNCNDNKDVFLEHYKSITIGAITLFSHARSLKIISPWKVSCNLECTRFLDNNIKQSLVVVQGCFFYQNIFEELLKRFILTSRNLIIWHSELFDIYRCIITSSIIILEPKRISRSWLHMKCTSL